MAKESADVGEPGDIDATIWRYMSFAKYVSLLETQSLFFAPALGLDDPYEGYDPWLVPQLREIVRRDFPNEDLEAKVAEHKDGMENFRGHMEQMAELVCVNCWHMNEDESMAMWQLYGGSEGAVAIRSTFGTLRRLLPDVCKVGLVDYVRDHNDIDLSKDPINLYTRFMYKRRGFNYEREIRAVKIGTSNGQLVKVNLRALVQHVYVAPKSDRWFRDVVENVTRDYGFDFEVTCSPFYDDPPAVRI